MRRNYRTKLGLGYDEAKFNYLLFINNSQFSCFYIYGIILLIINNYYCLLLYYYSIVFIIILENLYVPKRSNIERIGASVRNKLKY
jgi:hypothetical protein